MSNIQIENINCGKLGFHDSGGSLFYLFSPNWAKDELRVNYLSCLLIFRIDSHENLSI